MIFTIRCVLFTKLRTFGIIFSISATIVLTVALVVKSVIFGILISISVIFVLKLVFLTRSLIFGFYLSTSSIFPMFCLSASSHCVLSISLVFMPSTFQTNLSYTATLI